MALVRLPRILLPYIRATAGFALPTSYSELLFIHGPKVLNNCLHMPNVRMADK